MLPYEAVRTADDPDRRSRGSCRPLTRRRPNSAAGTASALEDDPNRLPPRSTRGSYCALHQSRRKCGKVMFTGDKGTGFVRAVIDPTDLMSGSRTIVD